MPVSDGQAAAPCGVLGDEALDGVAAEPACRGWWGTRGSSSCAGAFGQPGPQDFDGGRLVSGVQRSLRPLPWQRRCAPVPRWTSPQCQAGEFGDAQSGLDGEVSRSVVAAAEPGGAVGGGEQRVGLGGGQVVDDGPVARLGGMASTRWMSAACSGAAQRGVAEERVDRGQAGVAGRVVLPRSVSRCCRNAPIVGASRSARSKLGGLRPGAGARRSRAAA